MMYGEAGALNPMSRDSRSLEMALPEMDILLDYGHKNLHFVILEQKVTNSLVSSPLCG